MEKKQNLIQEDEIDLKELVLTLWRKRVFIVIFTVIITILGFAYAKSKTPIYEAQAVVKMAVYAIQGNDRNDNNKLFVALDIAGDVILELNTIFPTKKTKKEEDRNWIDKILIPQGTTNFINIVINGLSQEEANTGLEMIVKYLQKKYEVMLGDMKIQRENELEMISKQINNFDKIKKRLSSEEKLSSIDVITMLKAVENYDKLSVKKEKLKNLLENKNYINTAIVGKINSSEFPISPKKSLIVAVFFVTGFILSIFLVFFIQFISSFKEEKEEI